MTISSTPPSPARFRADGLAAVDRLLEGAIAERVSPGAVVALGDRRGVAHLAAFGRLSYADDAPAVTPATLYDLASLTKVVATATMAMQLVDAGRLDLDCPVRDFFSAFTGREKDRVTVRHLLAHAAGIAWWAPFFRDTRGWDAYVERIVGLDLAYPPGSAAKYSDLGIILLGRILELAAGERFEPYVRRRILDPLGMHATVFRPGPELLQRIAPTEDDPWRGRVVHGEVHDENAFAMGGVAPHAGLFGTAGDLARFAQAMLGEGELGGGELRVRRRVGDELDGVRLVSPEAVALFTRRADLVPGSSRALGWDTKSATGSSAGTLLSDRSYGHTGFTGTSLWIDPERNLFVLLLTNRVHPTRAEARHLQVRPALADAVVEALVDTRG